MVSPLHIELASQVSWPALEQIEDRGWMIRFGKGYTKRANSVTVLAPASADLPEQVAHIESLYRTCGLAPIFRLLSFVECPGVDSHLAECGYALVDRSVVLHRPLDEKPDESSMPTELDREAWLKIFDDISCSDPSKRALHGEIVRRIPAASLFAIQEHDGKPVAAGVAVLHKSSCGIFDLVTRPENRREGHATRLMNGVLEWARRNGACDAYLQVVGDNAPALRLYERLGYRPLYHYWYRVGPKSAASS